MECTEEQLVAELRWQFSRSSGKGGQHVNKTSTKVTIAWAPEKSRFLSETQKARLLRKAGKRLNAEGEILVEASAFRSQHQNRNLAVKKLLRFIREALQRPKIRKETKAPAKALKARREAKEQRSQLKAARRSPNPF